MAPRVQAKREDVGGAVVIRVDGVIDAGFRDVNVFEHAANILVIDLDAVRRITSSGVREWLDSLAKLAARSLYFINCRPSVVSQLNMVAGFAEPGVVVSLYLPYICTSCDTETERLLDLRRDFDVVSARAAASVKCPRCGGDAELDDDPVTYFSHVASRPQPVVPDAVKRVLDGEPDARRVVVDKHVSAQLTALWMAGALSGDARLKRPFEGLDGTVLVLTPSLFVTSDGAARLLPLAATAGVDLWLGRCRPEQLAVLPEALRISSVLVPAQCAGCSEGSVEATASDIAAEQSRLARACQSCGAEATAVVEAGGLARLAPDAPPAVLSYLAANPGLSRASSAARSADQRYAPMGRYNILSLIGVGGMAEVLLAEQRGPAGFHKRVVIKRILPSLNTDESFVAMFLREGRIAARISHPNVVQIFDLGQDGARYFLAMEYVQGWDLRTIMRVARDRQPFPLQLACRVIADVCAGLHAAHSLLDDNGAPLGLVHRDVTPHNILVSVDGTVKVADFGVAHLSDHKTNPGALKGKVAYMSPEHVNAALGPIDARADVFSAGLVLYELLTLHAPFRRETEHQSLHAVLSDEIPRVTTLRPDTPPALVRVVERALDRDRDRRFQSADEMRQALEEVLVGFGTATTSTQLARWLEALAVASSDDQTSMPTPGLTPTGVRPSPASSEADDDGDIQTKIVPRRSEG